SKYAIDAASVRTNRRGANYGAGQPTVVSWRSNRMDAFVRGTDNALWTKSWNGSAWSGYTQLGSQPFAGQPTAVSWGSNRIDLFVRGTDNAHRRKARNGSPWT